MSRPPEDRGGELRALFFESANEILQSLNEAGLELEARPSDEEVIRRIRRAAADQVRAPRGPGERGFCREHDRRAPLRRDFAARAG